MGPQAEGTFVVGRNWISVSGPVHVHRDTVIHRRPTSLLLSVCNPPLAGLFSFCNEMTESSYQTNLIQQTY